MKKRITKEERGHLAKVKSLPCSVCGAAPPSDAHHCRGYQFGSGQGMKSSHYDTIPLFRNCHQTGGHGVAFHAGKKTWEERHDTQAEHLEKTLMLLKYHNF